MTTQCRERAPTHLTRRVALKAGLGTALSTLSLPVSRAEERGHHLEEGSIPMSHHLDTPLARRTANFISMTCTSSQATAVRYSSWTSTRPLPDLM